MTNKVPLLDLTRMPETEVAEFQEIFNRILKSGYYIMGPDLQAFEKECAAYLGVKHAVTVSSGTDALLLAMMALNIGPEDEVICPTYTFFASAGTIWRLGAKPVFVDLDPMSYNCDVSQVKDKVHGETAAIMPVHLYGQSADMAGLCTVAQPFDIPIVEDACQAIGAKSQAGMTGSMGTMGCFSFFPTKNLGCFGDGGLVTTDDDHLGETLNVMRVHGGKPKYHHAVVGGNFRMDTLQAALLRPKLKGLDASVSLRQQNAAFYSKALQDAGLAVMPKNADDIGAANKEGLISLPPQVAPNHTYNQYCIRVPQKIGRDKMRQALGEAQVGSEIYYPIPLHLQECFKSLGHKKGDFPQSELAAEQTLALPIFPGLSEAELSYVVQQVAKAMGK